jgi:hypothetical protein
MWSVFFTSNVHAAGWNIRGCTKCWSGQCEGSHSGIVIALFWNMTCCGHVLDICTFDLLSWRWRQQFPLTCTSHALLPWRVPPISDNCITFYMPVCRKRQ